MNFHQEDGHRSGATENADIISTYFADIAASRLTHRHSECASDSLATILCHWRHKSGRSDATSTK